MLLQKLSYLDFSEDEMTFAANMGSLISCARQRRKWDFICRNKQIALITCLEDSTNEVELHELHCFLTFCVNVKLKIESNKQKMPFFHFADPGAFSQPAAEIFPASFP